MADVTRMTCPYCQTGFRQEERFRECPQCHMPHHEDCWRENGGCTTFGCNGQPTARPAPAPPGDWPPAADSDHIELSLDDLSRCAACGEEISVWDETCRRCGTPTSLPPSLARRHNGQARYPGMPAQPYPYGAFGNYSPPYLQQKKSPAAACLLNLLLPGAGYFYLNQVKKGFAILFVGVALGCFSYGLLTLVVILYAMVDCYKTAERMNQGMQY
jgi:TM2 domain-containing membrane protein YozV